LGVRYNKKETVKTVFVCKCFLKPTTEVVGLQKTSITSFIEGERQPIALAMG